MAAAAIARSLHGPDVVGEPSGMIILTEDQVNDIAEQILDRALAQSAALYEADGRTDVAYAINKSRPAQQALTQCRA